ncbi:MAG: DNA/RNA non-specific endonuclease [Chloracidobacterium sp.]|nr:DNA/RNA non-specific endonuclease [Chloracidobacterium sp.]
MRFGKFGSFRTKAPAVFLFVVLGIGCGRPAVPVPNAAAPAKESPSADISLSNSVHAAFGNPSNATADPANADNFLIVGDGSVISYNSSRGTANWISWRTVRTDLSTKIIRPEFTNDPRLPAGSRKIGYYDYSGSGYDRGHLVPSADRFADPRLNEETFRMTNIVPQKSALNQYPWQQLESHARALARRGNDVYQIAGCYGERERLKGKVTVPTNCWKVVVAVPRNKKIADLDPRMNVIAVDMPNIDGIEDERWERFRVTPREIEQRTGFDLFGQLPEPTQDRLETSILMKSP